VYLLNYTNPNAQHGWNQPALGPQTVSLLLPGGVKVTSVELLRAKSMIPFRSDGGVLRCTIPRVENFEVAASTGRMNPIASVAPRSINKENWSCELSGSRKAS
jgi:hypothetical protein